MKGVGLDQVMTWAKESSCRLYVRTGEAVLTAIGRRLSARASQVAALARMGSHVCAYATVVQRGVSGTSRSAGDGGIKAGWGDKLAGQGPAPAERS